MSAAVYGEFASCIANTPNNYAVGPQGCPAPLICVQDNALYGGQGCEVVCATNADCPDPQTFCASTFGADGGAFFACQINSCDPADGGPFNPTPAINGPCNALDGGDNSGTCLPLEAAQSLGFETSLTSIQWACSRAGTADGGCLWPGLLSADNNNCPQNQVCTAADAVLTLAGGQLNFPINLPVGSCAPICSTDGGTGPACSDPSTACLNIAAGTGSLQFGPYITTGACLPTGTNGCALGLGANEYTQCAPFLPPPAPNAAFCSCPSSCVADPQGSGIHYCLASCLVDTDCPTSGDLCSNGLCQPRYCPTIGASCTVQNANDGTCQSTWDNTLGCSASSFGICYLNGTATGQCDPAIGWNPANNCASGSLCVFGSCQQTCDPTSQGANGCPANGACTTIAGNNQGTPPAVCSGTCQAVGSFCLDNGDCCSGGCAKLSTGMASASQGIGTCQ